MITLSQQQGVARALSLSLSLSHSLSLCVCVCVCVYAGVGRQCSLMPSEQDAQRSLKGYGP